MHHCLLCGAQPESRMFRFELFGNFKFASELCSYCFGTLAFFLKTICAGTSRLQGWGHSAQTLCRRPHCVGPGNGWGRTGSGCGNMGGNNPFRCSVPGHAHIDKSGVFSGWGPSREAMLRLLPGVQPLRTLKDLGVQQLAGAAGMRSLSRGSMPRPGGSNA